jgi:replicative DNA helicase
MNHHDARAGLLAPSDFKKLTAAAGRMHKAPLYIDDTPGLSILQLRAKARRMKHQHDIQLIVVDYLQLLNSTSRRARDNRQQEIAEISSGVKALAKELKLPVIVLSQLNREVERDKNRKPRLSDLRESGAIEQDADIVALLFKANSDDDEAEEFSEGVAVGLAIAKQRNGPTGDVYLTFLKNYTRFESAARISPEDVPMD